MIRSNSIRAALGNTNIITRYTNITISRSVRKIIQQRCINNYGKGKYTNSTYNMTPIICGTLSSNGSSSSNSSNRWNEISATITAMLVLLIGGEGLSSSSYNNKSELEGISPTEEEEEEKELPVYKISDVEKHDGRDDGDGDGRIWMTYAGNVYDVTDFIPNHPGGAEHITQASGSCIEPFWNVYRQHFSTDLPNKILDTLIIGTLDSNDQERIDDALSDSLDDDDPYKNEPDRHPFLKMHTEYPANAEVPTKYITNHYLTPNELFYIRNHHPVPAMHQDKHVGHDYTLDIDLTALGRHDIIKLSLEDIKSLPKYDVIATLQCSGNRRSHFNNDVKVTSGTPWDQGAISTAKWTGPKLRDVLKLAGLEEEKAEALGIDYVRLESLDGMKASIHLHKAINPYGDCIIAYQMNDKPLPPDHGYPVRLIIPGYAAVRNVKWLSKIQLSETEAEGPWQRGLNYKITPPGITNIKGMDLDSMPSLNEVSIFSGITHVHKNKIDMGDSDTILKHYKPGDIIQVKASGWAWAGGGRNIVRVDLTGDNGKSWVPATITLGKNQKYGRAWAWVFWEVDNIPAIVLNDNTVQISSKAVDSSLNSQPENSYHMWNVRGLGNNSWFKVIMKV